MSRLVQHNIPSKETEPTSDLYKKVLEQLAKEKNISSKCSVNADTIIDFIARAGSYTFSPSAIVFYGLSRNEFDSEFGYIMAFAAFIANAFQMIVTQQITIKQHLNYLKHFYFMRKDRQGWEELLGIEKIENAPRTKFWYGIKNFFYFLGIELTLKWVITYYVSMTLPSLAQEVAWLNSDYFKMFLHGAVMLMLWPAISDRIDDIALPSFFSPGIVAEEIEKLRHAFYQILDLKKNDLLHHIEENKTQELITAIQYGQSNELPEKILDLSHDRNRIATLISDRLFYLGAFYTVILTTLYTSSNTGSYRETWENLDASLIARMGSILGDTCLGLFMAIHSGKLLAHLTGHMKKFIRSQPQKIIGAVINIIISALTIGSTLSANKAAKMPLLVLILGVLGTIFDNTYFGTELISKKIDQRAFHAKDHASLQHQQALIIYLYKILEEHYQDLTANEFVVHLKNTLEKNSLFLDKYEPFFHKQLPWTKGLTMEAVLDILTKPLAEAIIVIDRSGNYGTQRHLIEAGGGMTAMLMIGLTFIPPSNETTTIFLQYISPIMAIPIGISVVGLFGYCCRSQKNINENTPLILDSHKPNEVEEEKVNYPVTSKCTSFLYNAAKATVCLGAPLLIKYGTQILSNWFLRNIFDQTPDDADKISERVAIGLSMLSTGLITQSISIGMR